MGKPYLGPAASAGVDVLDRATADLRYADIGNGFYWASQPGFSPPNVVALTDAATISVPDPIHRQMLTVVLGGNRTLGAPAGTPVDGEQFTLRVSQDATGNRTLAYNAIYGFNATFPSITLTPAALAVDYIGFIYSSAKSKWQVISVVKGS